MSNYRVSLQRHRLCDESPNYKSFQHTWHLCPSRIRTFTFYFFPIRIIPQTLPVFRWSPLLCASLVIFVLLSPRTFLDWNSMPFVTFNRNYFTVILIQEIFQSIAPAIHLDHLSSHTSIISSPSPNRRTFLRVSLKSTFGSSYPNSLNAS